MTISRDSGNRLAPDAEAQFIGDGKNTILEGHHKLLWPSTRRVGVRAPGGVLSRSGASGAYIASLVTPIIAFWRLFPFIPSS